MIMKSQAKPTFLAAMFLVFSVVNGYSQIGVDWAAAIGNGLGLQDGTDLPDNSLLRIGYFSTLSDAQIQSNASDVNFLNNDFVEFDFGFVGDGFGDLAAHWSLSLTASAGTFSGKPIYLWAFDVTSTNIALATQHGIFYSTNANWRFPSDPGTTALDLADLTDGSYSNLLSGARIVVGGFGVGTSDVYENVPLFNLAAIPEPSTYLMLGLGLGVIAVARRRKS